MTDTRTPGLITPGNAPRLADLDNPAAFMPSRIGIFCDDCGTEHVADYLVRPDSTGPERFEIAREHLRGIGWECGLGGDSCPQCTKAGA